MRCLCGTKRKPPNILDCSNISPWTILIMQCKPTIATISLGECGLFSVQEKLYRAAEYGFREIELFYDDLEALGRSQSSSSTPSRADLVAAAADIRILCDQLHIQVLNLQPLRFFRRTCRSRCTRPDPGPQNPSLIGPSAHPR